jgi:glucoamylase
LYTAINQFKARGSIIVTSTSLSFYQKFLSTVTTGTYSSSTSTYSTIVAGMQAWADTFIATGQLHAATNGSMSEEFSRTDGTMIGARGKFLLSGMYARKTDVG